MKSWFCAYKRKNFRCSAFYESLYLYWIFLHQHEVQLLGLLLENFIQPYMVNIDEVEETRKPAANPRTERSGSKW